jgi:hypothetical protein
MPLVPSRYADVMVKNFNVHQLVKSFHMLLQLGLFVTDWKGMDNLGYACRIWMDQPSGGQDSHLFVSILSMVTSLLLLSLDYKFMQCDKQYTEMGVSSGPPCAIIRVRVPSSCYFSSSPSSPLGF